jgi:hypothetical protein
LSVGSLRLRHADLRDHFCANTRTDALSDARTDACTVTCTDTRTVARTNTGPDACSVTCTKTCTNNARTDDACTDALNTAVRQHSNRY